MPTDDDRPRRGELIMQIARERLKLNPNDVDALFALAAAQATFDDAKGGLQTLTRLAEIEPNYPGLWLLTTKLHAHLGETEKARQSRLRAQQSEPTPAKGPALPFQCPICEALVPVDAMTCPNCGVTFGPNQSMEDELDDLSHVAIQEMVQEELGGLTRPERPTPKGSVKPAPKSANRKGLTKGLALGGRAGSRTGKTNGLRGRTNGLRGRTNGLTNGLRGRTNGLTNGLGRTNGLTNGIGRTNGLTNGLGRTNGLTNGLGRTNGITNGLGRTNGLTNGLGSGFQSVVFQASRRGGGARAAGWKLYLIPLVSVSLLLLPLFFVPQYFGPAYPIQIDGKFGDWAGVPKMDAVPPSVVQNPDTDIVRVAVKDNLDYLSFYLEVRGSALAGGPAPQRLTNAFYAFIDVDRARSTGYQIQGIGADRMIRINTWGGAIVSASVWSFNTSRSRTDWNGWIVIGPVYAAGSGGQMEFEASWRDISQTHQPVDVAFASRSWDGQSDASDVVATSADRFLLVSQMTNAPLVASGNGTILAQITLRAVNGPVAVQGINVTFDGTFRVNSISAVDLIDASSGVLAAQPIAAVVPFVFSPITLASGDTRTFSIKPHVSTADGMTVGAFVRGVEDVIVSTGGVAVVGPLTTPTRLAYVGLVPSAPRIDGAFGEWTNLTSDPVGNVQPVWNRDVDLSAHGFRGFGNDTYFEASVVGTMLNGTMVPDLNPAFIPATGNGTSSGTVSPPPPPLTGTDSLRFFLDLDGNVSTGYRVGSLGADFLVEVTGQNGLILTSNALRFAGLSPYDWAWTTRGVAPAAKSGSQIEASVPGVRITNASRAFVQVRGWNGAMDDSLPSSPPISVLVASSMSPPVVGGVPSSSVSSRSFLLTTLVASQQWFFTNTTITGGNPPSDCPGGNPLQASTTAGASPATKTLGSGASICWYTPTGNPGTTQPLAGTVTLNLFITGSGSYTVYVIHCQKSSCGGTGGNETLGSATGTLGSPATVNVSISAPSGAWQPNSDYLEFRITAASGASLTVNYNGASGSGYYSWAMVPIPEFSHLAIPITASALVSLIARRWRRRENRTEQ